jgi:hypothetical protein
MRFGRFHPLLTCMAAVIGLGSCGSPGSGNRSSFLVAPAPTPPNSSFPSPQLSGVLKLSADGFTNTQSQHATEVEPSAASFGATIVTAFQIGRIFSGGGAAIGFATSSDGGISWTNDVLPGLTVFQGGTYSAASDAVVAYDAAHQVWLVSSLGVGNHNQVLVSRAPDGIHWGNPITVSTSADSDKNWITCDNTPSSPFFGHCYTEWDDPSNRGIIWMATSVDGGLTWTPSQNTAGIGSGVGGQPLVRPDGTVTVPSGDTGLAAVQVFSSHDGGATWTWPATISPISDHIVAGGLRAGALVSAAIDAQGILYVVWQDCRFRTNCSSNDVVMSTSSDGVTWSTPARIPIDDPASTVDHFIPVIAAESASGGAAAKLAIIYYFYPVSACSTNCALSVGLVSSRDGGSTWSAPTTLVGPMSLAWLPNTFSGSMVGDYFGATYSSGRLLTFFTIALPNMGTLLDEAIYASQASAAASVARFDSRFERALPGAKSDHPPRRFYDLENRYERPPRPKSP